MLTADEAAEPFCYLTTTGRVTGRDHTIEIWFAADGPSLFLLGSPRADWVRNLPAEPAVRVPVGGRSWPASAAAVPDAPERDHGASLLYDKYQPSYGGDLSSWRDGALLVEVRLAPA